MAGMVIAFLTANTFNFPCSNKLVLCFTVDFLAFTRLHLTALSTVKPEINNSQCCSRFYIQNLFSILNQTFETRLRQQTPTGVEIGKFGMNI